MGNTKRKNSVTHCTVLPLNFVWCLLLLSHFHHYFLLQAHFSLTLATSALLTTLPRYSLQLLNYLHSVAFSRCQLSVATSRRKSLPAQTTPSKPRQTQPIKKSPRFYQTSPTHPIPLFPPLSI